MCLAKLFLFGAPRLERGGALVSFDSRKALALLAYLALTRRPHRRDALAALLWPDSLGERARGALRRTLVPLRRALEGCGLETRRETVELRPGPLWVDVWAFEHGLGPEGQATSAFDPPTVEAAAELYTDGLLAGFSLKDAPEFDHWQLAQAERLKARALSAFEHLTRFHRDHGHLEAALAVARRWVTLDPLAESAHCALMELLALCGQRGAARAQFEECRRLLADELDVAPLPETLALAEAIQAGRVAQPPGLRPSRSSWPTGPADFFGREVELAKLERRLGEPSACRLLSLLGPGGVGKTALALHLAPRLAGAFADGVVWVPLAGLGAAELLPVAIAEALGMTLRGPAAPEAELGAALAELEVLLVLDNFEPWLAAAPLVSGLLAAARRLRLLVTSRERLAIEAEWCFEVEGLGVPPSAEEVGIEDYPAARLFLAHARRARPQLTQGEDWRRPLARICRLSQGMPLALELAAPWVRVLPLDEIAAHLAGGLDLLSSGRRDLPERHRSMRAVFLESWQRLTEEESRVFRRLSVFAGGFDRQAAAQVAGATLPVLAALVDRSFLTTTAEGRYSQHELLRQFGAEQLAQDAEELAATQRRLALFFCGLLADRLGALRGAGQIDALREIGAELDNVRRGWELAAAHGLDAALERAAEPLFHFFEIRCRFHEGRRATEEALAALAARPGGEGRDAAWQRAIRLVTLSAGGFELRLGDYGRASELFAEVSRLAKEQGATRFEGLAKVGLALAATLSGEFGAGAEHARAATAVLGHADDPWDRAIALQLQGEMAYGAQRYEDAEALLGQSLATFRELGDRRMVARLLLGRARLAVVRGQDEEARRQFEEGLALCRELGDRWGTALCLTRLGAVALRTGAPADAARTFADSLELCRAIGDRRGVVVSLNGLGQAALELGDRQAASRHLERALALAQELGSKALLLAAVVASAPLLDGREHRDLAAEALETAASHPALTKETGETVRRLRGAAAEAASRPPARRPLEETARAISAALARQPSPGRCPGLI